MLSPIYRPVTACCSALFAALEASSSFLATPSRTTLTCSVLHDDGSAFLPSLPTQHFMIPGGLYDL